MELAEWGVTDEHVDPGEQLLRLVAQSARRVEFYSYLLGEAHAGRLTPEYLVGSGVGALIGQRTITTENGTTIENGEYLRGLVELEAQERERCAKWSKMAVDAGLEARRVALAEQEAALVFAAIVAALEVAGLADRQAELLPAIAAKLEAA